MAKRSAHPAVAGDLKDAWRRGASTSEVARAVEYALSHRTDEECARLGLDELALSLAPDVQCQEPLMQAAMARPAWGTLWATRIVDRVLAYADAEDRARYVLWFENDGDLLDAWALAAVRRLRASRSLH